MNIELVLHILTLIPPLQFGVPAQQIPQAHGTGTLLIAACDPGEVLFIKGSEITGTADADGTARLEAPAQIASADSYHIVTRRGETKINGTLTENELLSGVCP